MNVLENMIRAVRAGGVILDLQVIRPDPRVECEGELVCEVDGRALFAKADAAAEAIDAAVARGQLTDEAVDDHDVLCYYPGGRELIEDFEDRMRRIPEEAKPRLKAIRQELAIRERCRLRRLQVATDGPAAPRLRGA